MELTEEMIEEIKERLSISVSTIYSGDSEYTKINLCFDDEPFSSDTVTIK